jgi:uncharacterized protein YyaL (SSP411 family)
MNKLQYESSPYLRQHMENPVEWRAWSTSILDEARELNKPILVSIGYSTCHWCHVMAHESFEDQETAEIMNSFFINVKIDREERPDLDHYYMNAVQAMGVSGGWPLHCFLSPDGKPFFGGTYFPPEPKYGRPSWKQILSVIHEAYHKRTQEINEQAEQLFQHLNQINDLQQSKSNGDSKVDPILLLAKIESSMDKVHGGFGTQPKFPNCQAIQLLFQLYFLTGNKESIHHSLLSLRQMCYGGIYDHIDGGFCRYSVDGNWDVPHFEKMLYDHAQLMQTLSIGYQYTNSVLFERIIKKSFDFFENSMQDECGLFYAAMDADSEGEEGAFYIWTEDALKEILGNEYDLFFSIFSYSSLDHFHTDKKVLRLKNEWKDDAHIVSQLQKVDHLISKLYTIREVRPHPSIDRKMIVSWNAMTVSAYVAWYRASLDQSSLKKAEKLMENIITLCIRNESKLCRYYINNNQVGFGFLEDYAYVIKALLDLYSCTLDDQYIQNAIQYFEWVDTDFKNPDAPIYNVSSSTHSDFKIQQIDWAETTYPNPNAILAWSCRYFYEVTYNERFLSISNSLLHFINTHALRHPLAMPSWVQQILNAEIGFITLKANNAATSAEILQDVYIPSVMNLANGTDFNGLIFCFDRICHKPVHSKEEVLSLFSEYTLRYNT